MKRYCYLLFIMFGVLRFHAAFAQSESQRIIDSLMIELSKAKEDTARVKLMNKISFAYCNMDGTKGLEYAKKSAALATKIDYKLGLAHANNNLGNNYQLLSDYAQSLKYYFMALKLFEEVNNKEGIGMALGNIGLIYGNERNYPKAIEYYNKALTIFRELGKKNSIAVNTGNLGNAYNDQDKYDEALPYYKESLAIYEELGDESGAAIIMGNIGNVYEGKKDHDKAIEYFNKAYALNKKLGDKYGMALNLYTTALTYQHISASLGPVEKMPWLRKAKECLVKAIAMDNEIGYLDGVLSKSEVLAEVSSDYGDYKEAFFAFKEFSRLRDTVYSKEKSEAIERLQTEREVELKNKQIELDKLAVAKKRNERVFYIAGIILLLIVIGVVLRNYYIQKVSNRLLAAEKEKSEELLLNILPSEVADELKDRGATTAKYFDEVTVLFTDFVNFTGAGERMGTQRLVDELHNCFKAFDNIISKYNIEKIKTIGDAYLAVSGLPLSDPKHAENIINAAKDITAFMLNRKKELGNDTFDIRVGIHSGSVVAGIVGVKKFSYDIWGDTVNTAARMEQNSEAGKINISETTYELVKHKFASIYRGEIDAKNKGMMKMYFVN